MTRTTQPTRRLFTVHEYHQMADAGILGEDDRVELIDGEIIQMPPIYGPHAGHVNRLTRVLVLRFADVAVVAVQNPVVLGEHSEPEPDLALLRPRPDDYTTNNPTPADVLVVIEVADSTAAYDRRVKAPLYAQYGIPEYWLLDVQQKTVTLYRDPSADGYRTVQVLRRGERWAPLAFPDREIAVADIFSEA